MLERKKMEREDENTGRSTVIHRSRSSPSQQASLGWLIFTWGVPLAHNHPPLSLSAKISKNTGISLYTEGRTERGEGREVISPKWYAHKPGPALSRTAPTISRHDLSRSRVRAVVDEGEESDGVDDERGRRREKIRRWRRRGTSARSRATIIFPVRPAPLPFPILLDGGGGAGAGRAASLPLSNYSLTPCAIYLRAPRS